MAINLEHVFTAEEIFLEMSRMPSSERNRFFSLLAMSAFRENDLNYEQVFGHLNQESFTAAEAAEYLEISIPTLRRLVQSNKLVPIKVVGRNQFFSPQSLSQLKSKRADS